MEAKGGVTNASFGVLANTSNSQIKVHIPYGGVYPVLAKREHTKNLPILLEQALKEAKLEKENSPVDVIAVTYGPGLEMCLWEGIIFAQKLAKKWEVPLIPVNHMEGHVLSVFGKDKGKFKIPKIKFPMLSLLVSGRHTQLVLSKKPARPDPSPTRSFWRGRSGGWLQYEIIGTTLDDAVGEAFDKVARMLDLPYPGGPEISKLAEEARILRKGSIAQAGDRKRGALLLQRLGSASSAFQQTPARGIFQQKNIRALEEQSPSLKLPRPMLHSKNFDFSFAGLKTAVLYLIHDLKKEHSNILQNNQMKMQIALEFENAAIECLTHKTKKAIEKYKIKTLIVAGGVAANKHLRNEMQKITTPDPSSKRRGGIKLLFPTRELSGDNSLMIGIAGYLNYLKNKKKVPKLESIKATGNLRL